MHVITQSMDMHYNVFNKSKWINITAQTIVTIV